MRKDNVLSGIVFIVVTVTVTCCSGGTSSGTKRDPGEPPEIDILHPHDQEYVRRWAREYHPSRATFVNSHTCVVFLGDLWTSTTPIYRAAILVHEASHCEYRDTECCPGCELRANRRAAEALLRINKPEEAGVWLSFDGKHQEC